MLFNVHFEVITDESAEHGEPERLGTLATAVSLRDALEMIRQDASSHCALEAIEPSESPVTSRNAWINVMYGRDWITGEFQNYSLHSEQGISPASMRRLVKLLNR